MMTALSIAQVTRAGHSGQPVTPVELQKLLIPCLGRRRDYLNQRPREQMVGDDFRSGELAEAARSLFPKSCHTPYSPALVERFEAFEKARIERAPPVPGGADRVQWELHRPMALLVMDWAASLFDGALTPEIDGFINDKGMPLLDGWLTLLHISGSHGEAFLLSWVPQWLGPDVNRAIQIDAAQSLTWLVVTPQQGLTLHGWENGW